MVTGHPTRLLLATSWRALHNHTIDMLSALSRNRLVLRKALAAKASFESIAAGIAV